MNGEFQVSRATLRLFTKQKGKSEEEKTYKLRAKELPNPPKMWVLYGS